ncbi:MAG TPA: four helix bundle protein [Balneolaceae bacterium]|nr:four helix bundle protein [Balneolaceae bacterium]
MDVGSQKLDPSLAKLTSRDFNMIQSYQDLDVYKRSYKLAMDIFWKCQDFPQKERYSLTSQIIRSSRSISANITEGWAKRKYENQFKLHLIHSLGSNAETENWIHFANDCGYLTKKEAEGFINRIEVIGKMLTKLHQNWQTY